MVIFERIKEAGEGNQAKTSRAYAAPEYLYNVLAPSPIPYTAHCTVLRYVSSSVSVHGV